MEKPLSVRIKDAKAEIIETINKQNLPLPVLEPIMLGIYEETRMLAEKQYQQEKAEWEKENVE